MNIKPVDEMLAVEILAAAGEGTIPFEVAKDEFVRRFNNGGPRAKKRAEKNLVKLASACDHLLEVPNVDDHIEKWEPSDLDILLDLHKRLGTWGAVYSQCGMSPKRIAEARNISAKSVSVAKSVYNRKNRESVKLTPEQAVDMLTLG